MILRFIPSIRFPFVNLKLLSILIKEFYKAIIIFFKESPIFSVFIRKKDSFFISLEFFSTTVICYYLIIQRFFKRLIVLIELNRITIVVFTCHFDVIIWPGLVLSIKFQGLVICTQSKYFLVFTEFNLFYHRFRIEPHFYSIYVIKYNVIVLILFK